LKKTRNYLSLFVTVSIILGLDQWTKWLVRENIAFTQSWLPEGLTWLSPYARIVHWYNSGAAFGMFQGYGWVFIPLALLVSILIIYYYPQIEARDWWLKLAMGMEMGGALGNVIDRFLLEGKVTDFISVGNFPVFNIADASVSVGVVIMVIGVYLTERKQKKQALEINARLNESDAEIGSSE
jgi:signal peptidase II